MKKVLSLVAIAGMFAVVACGPSKEEVEAKEKARKDSIEAVEKARQDSVAQAAEAEKARLDSIAKVEEQEKARQDSIAKAEEAKNKKGSTKPAAPKKQEPTAPKSSGGRSGATKQ